VTSAIVLAAGRGSRLGRHARHLPKALVRAGGRTLLDWQLQALRACGIERIVVVGGYRGEQLARTGVELVLAARWNETGPIASLLAARPARFDDGFVLAYADCPHHPANIAALLAAHAEVAVAGDRAWQALWRARHGDPLVDAESYVADGGRLRAIGATPHSLDEVQAQFAGLVRFSAAGWARAEPLAHAAHDATALLAAMLREGIAVADVPLAGRWCEIDGAQDLRLCRRHLHANDAWSHDWREPVAQGMGASWA
jgi:choline kinase